VPLKGTFFTFKRKFLFILVHLINFNPRFMKKIYFLFSALFITSLSFGQVITSDDISYPDGSLVGNGSWVNHSGTAGDMLVASGQVVVQHGTPSEDANIPFTAAGVIYFGLDFSVDDLGAPYNPANSAGGNTNDFEYFAHFKDGGFGFRARLDIVPPSGAGDFSVGISSSTSTAQATWATDLTYGVTYRAVVKYDQTSGLAQLWIDPDPSDEGGSTSISGTADGATTIESFALRQSDSSENETVRVDNIVIGSSFALSTKENQIDGFELYPNPTSEAFITISSDKRSPMKVSVFDILGKQVVQRTITDNRLNVSNLNTGVYILRAEQDNAFTTRKLIIN